MPLTESIFNAAGNWLHLLSCRRDRVHKCSQSAAFSPWKAVDQKLRSSVTVFEILCSIIEKSNAWRNTILASDTRGWQPQPQRLVIQRAGVDAALLEKTDLNLYVPLYGQAESLNVAVAAAILVYHLRG